MFENSSTVTFAIFVSEPWIVESASNQLGTMAVKKVKETP